MDLLAHVQDRFGIVTVQDVTLYDTTGVPVLELDTLKMSNVSSETQEKQIKGGRYADLLLTYNYGRTINLEFQDALLSMQSMKHLWGADMTSGSIVTNEKLTDVIVDVAGDLVVVLPMYPITVSKVINVTDNVEYTVTTDYTVSGNTITIVNLGAEAGETVKIYYTSNTNYIIEEKTAVSNSGIKVTATAAPITGGVFKVTNVTNNDVLVLTTDYTRVGDVFTFINSSAIAGDVIELQYEAAISMTGFTALQSLLKSSSFPGTVKFVGKTFFIEQQTGKMVEAEIEIPKLKLNSNFTLTMEAEGDASVFDFSGIALVDTNRELIKFKTLRYVTE